MGEINSFLGTGWSFPPQFSKTEKSVKREFAMGYLLCLR